VQAPVQAAHTAYVPLDDDGFRALFRAEFRYVWTSLRRLGVPPRDLEDVAHEVFLEVHRHLPRYDPRRPARPWLFAFAVRFASDYRKQARVRREGLGEVVDTADPSAPPDAGLERREAREIVAEALGAVEIGRRAVFILFELDEVPMPEIAESLGLPVNTAYSRLRLARDEFAAAVRRIQRTRGAR
jgi:RNA polymerase sigma-70 factor (ECF subfamily)